MFWHEECTAWVQVRFCDILWPTSWHLKYLFRNPPFTGGCWSPLYNLSVKRVTWKHMGDQKDPALFSPLPDQIIDIPPAWWPPSWQPGSSDPAYPFPREWWWELPLEWIFRADAHWRIWRQSGCCRAQVLQRNKIIFLLPVWVLEISDRLTREQSKID